MAGMAVEFPGFKGLCQPFALFFRPAVQPHQGTGEGVPFRVHGDHRLPLGGDAHSVHPHTGGHGSGPFAQFFPI